MAALVPADPVEQGLIFLYGGGGSRETLAESQPLWERWMAEGLLPPTVVITATVRPLGFWLDDPEGASGDERLLEETLAAEVMPAVLRERYGITAPPAVLGISMGGHAALRLALTRPEELGPVAVLQPMVEPGWQPEDSPPRCRSHYPPGVPETYLGQHRDPARWQALHPAWEARRCARAGRAVPPLYLEAAELDRFGAQEGAAFVHEALFELGIAHRWVLSEGADHVGPSLVPRLTEAARWLGKNLRPPA